METTGAVNGDGRVWVVALARRVVDRLTPEYVSYGEAANFGLAAQRWSGRRGGFMRWSQPKPDGASRVGVVETGAVVVALMAAQAAQDALREAVADSLKSRVSRLVKRLRRRFSGDSPNTNEQTAGGTAPVRFTAAQLKIVNQCVYERLLRASYPEATAKAFADATVGELAMNAGEDR